jgi:hypothetical protein
MRHKIMLIIAALVWFAVGLCGCTSPDNTDNPVAPASYTVHLEARPNVIPADGTSRLVVFTELLQDGQAVSDSSEVILLNTMGSLGRGVVYTRNGVALDTLTSDTTAGSGWLIAYAHGVRDSVEIMFTSTR